MAWCLMAPSHDVIQWCIILSYWAWPHMYNASLLGKNYLKAMIWWTCPHFAVINLRGHVAISQKNLSVKSLHHKQPRGKNFFFFAYNFPGNSTTELPLKKVKRSPPNQTRLSDLDFSQYEKLSRFFVMLKHALTALPRGTYPQFSRYLHYLYPCQIDAVPSTCQYPPRV